LGGKNPIGFFEGKVDVTKTEWTPEYGRKTNPVPCNFSLRSKGEPAATKKNDLHIKTIPKSTVK
jgi:hypothetical protein